MRNRKPRSGQSLFEGFRRRARGVGLTEQAEHLAAFNRLPDMAQDAMWSDLAERVDCQRQWAGLVT